MKKSGILKKNYTKLNLGSLSKTDNAGSRYESVN